MSKTTYVTLRVLDDDEAREWWDALGLPEPARWNTHDGAVFQPSVYCEAVMEVEAAALVE